MFLKYIFKWLTVIYLNSFVCPCTRTINSMSAIFSTKPSIVNFNNTYQGFLQRETKPSLAAQCSLVETDMTSSWRNILVYPILGKYTLRWRHMNYVLNLKILRNPCLAWFLVYFCFANFLIRRVRWFNSLKWKETKQMCKNQSIFFKDNENKILL